MCRGGLQKQMAPRVRTLRRGIKREPRLEAMVLKAGSGGRVRKIGAGEGPTGSAAARRLAFSVVPQPSAHVPWS
jgi:hypothetical protein